MPIRILITGAMQEPVNYLNALQAAGFVPEHRDKAQMPLDFSAYDGLLVPGGADVDPHLYGEDSTESRGVDRALDDYELEALAAFTAAKKPVLGICRGHQVVNVFFGGSLYQQVPDKGIAHSVQGKDALHGSTATGFIRTLYGEAPTVNSSHHQATLRLGEGLEAVQWSPDGLVEAACHTVFPVWTTQWHPERLSLSFARPDAVNGLELFRFFYDRFQ